MFGVASPSIGHSCCCGYSSVCGLVLPSSDLDVLVTGHTSTWMCVWGGGSMVDSDRLNVPAIDNSSH